MSYCGPKKDQISPGPVGGGENWKIYETKNPNQLWGSHTIIKLIKVSNIIWRASLLYEKEM